MANRQSWFQLRDSVNLIACLKALDITSKRISLSMLQWLVGDVGLTFSQLHSSGAGIVVRLRSESELIDAIPWFKERGFDFDGQPFLFSLPGSEEMSSLKTMMWCWALETSLPLTNLLYTKYLSDEVKHPILQSVASEIGTSRTRAHPTRERIAHISHSQLGLDALKQLHASGFNAKWNHKLCTANLIALDGRVFDAGLDPSTLSIWLNSLEWLLINGMQPRKTPWGINWEGSRAKAHIRTARICQFGPLGWLHGLLRPHHTLLLWVLFCIFLCQDIGYMFISAVLAYDS
jgi:hypothetical protein